MRRAQRADVAAANWLITQADGPLSSEPQVALEAWLDASDGNKAAYWRLEFGWDEAGRANAINFEREELAPAAPYRAPIRRWIPAAIAASLVLAVSMMVFNPFGQGSGVDADSLVAANTYS